MSARLARFGVVRIVCRAPDGRQQLLVDVSTLARADAGTGIQRVVRALWLQLKALEGDVLIVTPVIGARQSGYRIAPADFLDNRIAGNLASLPSAEVAEGDIFLGLDLAAHVVPYRARDLKQWRSHGVQLSFVVYDLLPVLHPAWFSPKGRRNYLRWISFVTRNADQIICITHAVRRDVEEWIGRHVAKGHRPARMAVIRLSGDIKASNPSKGLPADADDVFAWAIARPTVLMVGTIEPRKGYDQALNAFEHIWAEGDRNSADAHPNLVIVGRSGWMTDAFQQRLRGHPEHGRRLRWIDHASDEYLERLYSACRGLLFTSRAEGFGLPLLEASARGKPALARDLAVFREFAPPSVTFFATDKGDELAVIVRQWLADIARRPSAPTEPSLVGWRAARDDLVAALDLRRSVGSAE